jgi:hypothetical protein
LATLAPTAAFAVPEPTWDVIVTPRGLGTDISLCSIELPLDETIAAPHRHREGF